MSKETAIDLINRQEWLDTAADALQPAILDAFEAGGEAGQEVKNFLHGTWLGHQLHPVLTDVPVGAWTVAAVLDCLELAGKKDYAPGADAAVAIGLVGAVGAAVTGITDWTETSGKNRKIGLMHGLMNTAAAALYTTSLICRGKKSRDAGIGLSMLGYTIAGMSAYLGGHLVFNDQVGVNHTADTKEYPEEFVPVLAENDLQENSMKCVKVEDVPILLAKKNGVIYALQHNCSHMGGPLSEGELIGESVRCPWHGSRFSLEDGSVIDGPSTYQQPTFDVRVRDGQVEVKKSRS